MSRHCFNSTAADRHAHEQGVMDQREIALEKARNELYGKLSGIAKQHPVLQAFVEENRELLDAFMLDYLQENSSR